MKILSKKERENVEFDSYGFCLKYKAIKSLENEFNRVELWLIEGKSLARDCYLFEKDEAGYWLYIEMNSCSFWENCRTFDFVETCKKFNTILATIKA